MADLSTIDLVLRSELAQAISQSQNDTNLTNIETAVNALISDTNALRRHGEMYQKDNATDTGALSSGVWTHYDFGTIASEHTHEVTFDVSTGTLACPSAGNYLVICSVSFLGTTGNTVTFAPGVGDGATQVVQDQHQIDRKLGSGDVGAAGFVGVVAVTPGQKIGVMIKQDAVNALTIENFTLHIQGMPT